MVAFKRIHQNIFSLNKMLFLKQVGGFRCDYRGALDLGVTPCLSQNISKISKFTDKDLLFASCEGQPWPDGDLLADRTILGHWIYLIYAFGFWLVQVHSVFSHSLWFYAVNFPSLGSKMFLSLVVVLFLVQLIICCLSIITKESL